MPAFPPGRLMTASFHALRLKLATAATGALVLTAGHAVARNHDVQVFKPPRAAALHDRAPGPALRTPG